MRGKSMDLWFLAFLFFLVGCLFIGLSIPLINRRIKPNPWYGFRTPKTLRSPEIWYLANEYLGRLLCKAGIGICVVSVILPIIPGMNAAVYAFIQIASMVTLLLGVVIKSFIYISKL